ncbi:MAG: hypothetical protein KF813_07475 [Trueperaceae bacterium]|nr:hypothetical protein [Trueperaceae bacterium]
MIQTTNRVVQAFSQGRKSYGIYVMTPATRMIELLASSGLDFVRIDMEGGFLNLESVNDMIRACHAYGITPFVRVQGPDEWQIRSVLKMGALGVIIPRVSSAAEVEQAVRAAKPPPLGERHINSLSPTGGFGALTEAEHLSWVRKNIVLSAQIETRAGVESVADIVKVAGLDMVQSGRGDLSYSYGVSGDQYHETVLRAEKSVIDAGRSAGLITSVQYYPMRHQDHISRVRTWAEYGVSSLCLGSDADIVHQYRNLLIELKR